MLINYYIMKSKSSQRANEKANKYFVESVLHEWEVEVPPEFYGLGGPGLFVFRGKLGQ